MAGLQDNRRISAVEREINAPLRLDPPADTRASGVIASQVGTSGGYLVTVGGVSVFAFTAPKNDALTTGAPVVLTRVSNGVWRIESGTATAAPTGTTTPLQGYIAYFAS